jgi:selenocysteine-specific elongation factor
LTCHSGSAEVEARVLLLEGDALAPGANGWGQLRFADPIALVKGDLFVLRTPNATVAGGEVVDAHARRHRRRETGLIEGLRVLREGSPAESALAQLRARGPLDAAALGERIGLAATAARAVATELVDLGQLVRLGDWFLAPESWLELAEATTAALAEYHRLHRLRPGMPREELRSRVGATARLFPHALNRLSAEGALRDRDGIVRLADHVVELNPEQIGRAERLIAALGAQPYTPPGLSELPPDTRADPELVRALVDQGRLVTVDGELAFTAAAFAEMRERVVAILRERGKVTVADIRDLFGSSRKYALGLLELLDRDHVTRRIGDDRVLV